MSDNKIERGILEFLKVQHIQGLRIFDVHVERGVVTVRGFAETFFAKRVCRECCRRVTGVRGVVDMIDLAAA